MTPRERIEKEILLDIVLESSRRIAGEDTEDPIRTEVTERLRRLCGDSPAKESGSVRERGLKKAGSSQGSSGCVRVLVDGKKISVPLFMLEKEPMVSSPTGFRWKLKHGYTFADIAKARKGMAGEGGTGNDEAS